MRFSFATTLLFTLLALSAIFFVIGLATTEANARSKTCGEASWYALTSKTASGERMNPNKMTAAHRTLPFGSKVRVTNARNGRSVIVRINDRGPFVRGRIIDVSKAAAGRLGFINAGRTKVCVQRIG